MLTAEQILCDRVITIGPNQTIRDAIELLLAKGVSGLPVVDDDGRLVGILTEFALLALAYDSDIASQSVAEHMTRDVLTVETTTPVSKVADLFIVHRVRRVPVVNQGRLAGLVSRRDVIEALYNAEAPVVAS